MATPISEGLDRLKEGGLGRPLGETTETRIKPRLPYAGNYADGAPDEMPEVARGVIMLRGSIEGVRIRAENIMRAFADLHIKLNPALDMTEKGMAVRGEYAETVADVAAMRARGGDTTDPLYPVSPLGVDLRTLQDELNEVAEYMERAEAAIERATGDLRV